MLCSRCVRFCDEVTGTGELGIFNRGDRAEIGVAPGVELDNNYSLNTVDICPVGALTSRDFRFQKRVWMLKSRRERLPGLRHRLQRAHRPRGGPHLPAQAPAQRRGQRPLDVRHGAPDLQGGARREAPDRPRWPTARTVTWAEAGAAAGRAAEARVRAGGRQPAPDPRGDVPAGAWWPGGAPRQRRPGRRRPGRRRRPAAGRRPHAQPGGAGPAGLDRGRRGTAWPARIAAAAGPVLIHGGDPAADPAVAAALAGAHAGLPRHPSTTPPPRAATLVLPGAMWAEKDGISSTGRAGCRSCAQAVARDRQRPRGLARAGRPGGRARRAGTCQPGGCAAAAHRRRPATWAWT